MFGESHMSRKAKRIFLGCLITEVLTVIIITVHFIITPTHRPYALATYAVVLLIGFALLMTWAFFKNKHKN